MSSPGLLTVTHSNIGLKAIYCSLAGDLYSTRFPNLDIFLRTLADVGIEIVTKDNLFRDQILVSQRPVTTAVHATEERLRNAGFKKDS